MSFDQVAILDWSAAAGPRKGKDSIWLGLADATGTATENIPTRHLAAQRLRTLTENALSDGSRLLIGADFAFGFPTGFAAPLVGASAAMAVWNWLADQVTDTPGNLSNYREVAARMNGQFKGGGPFWGNGARRDVPGLPRLKPPLPLGLGAHRHCDLVARESGASPKTVWQLAGAGAVGAQVLTGVPVLNALRRTFAGQLSVWPFDLADTPVLLAEVYPSLLHAQVRAAVAKGQVVDQAQVGLLATALFRHARLGNLPRLMTTGVPAPVLAEEGWLLGAGQSALLASVLD